MKEIYLGAAYYPEVWPKEEVEKAVDSKIVVDSIEGVKLIVKNYND